MVWELEWEGSKIEVVLSYPRSSSTWHFCRAVLMIQGRLTPAAAMVLSSGKAQCESQLKAYVPGLQAHHSACLTPTVRH